MNYPGPDDPTATDLDIIEWACDELWEDIDAYPRPSRSRVASRITTLMVDKNLSSFRKAAKLLVENNNKAAELEATAKFLRS